MNTQFYFVSVQEALRAGRTNLKYIPIALVVITGIIYTWLLLNHFFTPDFSGKDELPFRQIAPLVLIPLTGLLAAFFWRNAHSAAWKIWALENVQDVHRLYQLALNNGMISKRGSWLNHLEFKTADQRQRLVELETRLDEPRQMETPALTGFSGEQAIGYSFKMTAVQFAIFIPFFLFLFLKEKQFAFFPFGWLILFLIVVQLVRWLPRIGKPAPIRFDDATLTIRDNPPVAWSDITNIYSEKKRRGKGSVNMLVIETKTEPQQIKLETTDIAGSDTEIEQTLYDYWAQGLHNKPDSRYS